MSVLARPPATATPAPARSRLARAVPPQPLDHAKIERVAALWVCGTIGLACVPYLHRAAGGSGGGSSVSFYEPSEK